MKASVLDECVLLNDALVTRDVRNEHTPADGMHGLGSGAAMVLRTVANAVSAHKLQYSEEGSFYC